MYARKVIYKEASSNTCLRGISPLQELTGFFVDPDRIEGFGGRHIALNSSMPDHAHACTFLASIVHD